MNGLMRTLTSSTTHSHGCAHLSQELRAGLQGPQRGSQAPRDPNHAEGVTQPGCALIGKAGQGADAAQTWAQVHHLANKKGTESEENALRDRGMEIKILVGTFCTTSGQKKGYTQGIQMT